MTSSPHNFSCWRPTPATAQQEITPAMGSKMIPTPCRNGDYIPNTRWEYFREMITSQLKLSSSLRIRTQRGLQGKQEWPELSWMWSSSLIPRNTEKQTRITEHPKLEGTHQDHPSHPGPAQDSPKSGYFWFFLIYSSRLSAEVLEWTACKIPLLSYIFHWYFKH